MRAAFLNRLLIAITMTLVFAVGAATLVVRMIETKIARDFKAPEFNRAFHQDPQALSNHDFPYYGLDGRIFPLAAPLGAPWPPQNGAAQFEQYPATFIFAKGASLVGRQIGGADWALHL